MKIKTAHITGRALDWAVSQCEGFTGETYLQSAIIITTKPKGIQVPHNGDYIWFSPTSNWAQGGPIIEREGIMLEKWKTTGQWQAANERVTNVHTAATPLIAAMRCYVSSMLGDEVEIPKGLKL